MISLWNPITCYQSRHALSVSENEASVIQKGMGNREISTIQNWGTLSMKPECNNAPAEASDELDTN